MATTATRDLEHLGETHGMANHDRDIIHELGKRLDALWRYDQYIANAEDNEELREFWRTAKRQDMDCVKRLRQLITREIENGCF